MKLAGRCAISEEDFWNMSLRYFYNYTAGWEVNRRETWEQARLVAYYSYLSNPNIRKNARIKITDIYKFSWEEDEEAAQASKLTDKERTDMLNIMAGWRKEREAKAAMAKNNP